MRKEEKKKFTQSAKHSPTAFIIRSWQLKALKQELKGVKGLFLKVVVVNIFRVLAGFGDTSVSCDSPTYLVPL